MEKDIMLVTSPGQRRRVKPRMS